MGSIIKVEAEGKIRIFRGKDDVDAQCKLDAWVERKEFALRPEERCGEYLKIRRMYGEECAPLEVEFYQHLEGTGLTPKLLRYGDFFSFSVTYAETGLVLSNKFSYIAVERFGKSLEEIYGSSPECMNSSETMRKNKLVFDRTFPSKKFPENVRESVRKLIERLSKACLDHQDFHAGNVLTNERGQLKCIDFECAAITTTEF
ncbi:divergent serine/threonine protein kinase [Tokyovirus A1]|uniref:divergent serine/threonine protein kinase n=1 Tax=Tokyovirus A1 TaxID=1826170 RepID=UPI0007A9602D|nr:divergent serine/threonine protein kinase [Tokyovirus A1]BAU80269.1 divergent serine/threonine protein kinase [Tokyovirus A1]